MSDLYRSAIGARLNRLPQPHTVAPYQVDDDNEDNEEDETDEIGELPSMPPPGG